MSTYGEPAYRGRRAAAGDAHHGSYESYGSTDPYRAYPDQYAAATTADGYGSDGYDADGYRGGAHPGNGHRADRYAANGYADDYAVDSYAADGYSRDSYATDEYGSDSYAGSDGYRGRHSDDGFPESTGSASGRAAVGSAAVGSAAVGTAAVGAAPVGGAGAPSHRYDWSGNGRATGRASVPGSPTRPGTARGRARVRPPGGPGGPGGPGDDGDEGRPRRKKRRWLRNTLLSFLAVMVMSAGGGMLALSYYVDDVRPPDELELSQASRIFFADGTEMTVLMEENREVIDTTNLTIVQNAVVAAEDNKFWEHSGVDFIGIARAAWNNLRGGELQGASTITQQYARAAGNLHGQTYRRKLQEAAMAYKLTQKYSKEQILDFYLNTVYFGRGAYGIEAAAKAYFGISASELTVAQAAMLAGIIRYPDDGSGLSPYDPMHNPEDQTVAYERWRWVLGRMVAMGKLTPEERDAMEFPEVIEPSTAQPWYDGPQGPIVRQVMRELEAMNITDIRTGGYRITTTIVPKLQEAALRAAYREYGGSLWDNVEENVGAALVAIDPATGEVLAYFGGDDGTGYDLAGRNWDDNKGWYGGRPPGSTFKIYTLVAALREGVALDTHWKTTPYTPSYRSTPIHNAGRTAENCEGKAPDYCTLRWATQYSYNVPFAYFSEAMGTRGPRAITQAAWDAGITLMTGMRQTPDGEEEVIVDFNEIESLDEIEPLPFFHEVAFGQYPITVLDHASGVATLAAGGVYHKPHFVKKVEKRNEETGEWEVIVGDRIAGEQRIEPQIAYAVTDVLSTIPALNGVSLAGGRPAAAKTGTWEYAGPGGGNADVWMVGYTPQIAVAVWVGDPEKHAPIRYTWGESIPSHGLPSHIWKQFMDEAHQVMGWEIVYFPQALPIGDSQHPYANGEEPEEEDEDKDRRRCRGLRCPGGPGGGDPGDEPGPDPGDPGDPGDGDGGGDDGGEGGGDVPPGRREP